MLNSDALTQLNQLKKDIRDQKDIAEGTVRGTSNRYGFLALDDGRDCFLNPDLMQQLLPGDRVRANITQPEKRKWNAEIEKVLKSSFSQFVGRYSIKGKHHFVISDHPQMSRSLFVPPKSRKKHQDQDLVVCQIIRHPYGDGRAQAKVISNLGAIDKPFSIQNYIKAKYELNTLWGDSAKADDELLKIIDGDTQANADSCLDIPFLSIDAETTLDIDDAIYAESSADGWKLHCAIADPSHYIAAGSDLDKAALLRGASVYIPGGKETMLPKELSHQGFALQENTHRRALVATIDVAADGKINGYEFAFALVRNQHKLSYVQVSEFLQGKTDAVPANTTATLQALEAMAQARRQWREQNQLLNENNWDYYYQLNSEGKIEDILRQQATRSQPLVEESMLALNSCAGEFLASHQAGIFSVHQGFRDERLGDIEETLKGLELFSTDAPLNQLESFAALFRQLGDEKHQSLKALLKRWQVAAELSQEPLPHCGMGMPHYAMVTSPIRRYQDLVNHRLIKAILNSEKPSKIQDKTVTTLQEAASRNRQAARQCEQYLLCDYLANCVGKTFKATIVTTSVQGIGFRLNDNGYEHFLRLRNPKGPTLSHDPKTMIIEMGEQRFELEQDIEVVLKKVDRSAFSTVFELASPGK